MRRTAGFAAIAVGCLAMALSAQTRPDFSGRWTSAPEPTADAATAGERGGAAGRGGRGRGGAVAVGDMGSGWGEVITITQDAKALVVEYPFFSRGDLQPPLRFTYALDGALTSNTVTMGRGRQEQSARARWDGDALVLSSSYSFPHPETGQQLDGTVTRTLSFASPTTLVVEVTRSGVLGGQPSTTRTTYRKL